MLIVVCWCVFIKALRISWAFLGQLFWLITAEPSKSQKVLGQHHKLVRFLDRGPIKEHLSPMKYDIMPCINRQQLCQRSQPNICYWTDHMQKCTLCKTPTFFMYIVGVWKEGRSELGEKEWPLFRLDSMIALRIYHLPSFGMSSVWSLSPTQCIIFA